MKITTVGIDLAKNVFQIHGIDQHGKAVLKKQLKRAQMAPFFVNLPPCLVGMEACGSAHHWARKLQVLGHTVRLMAPQFVKPYVIKTNKNDAADAEAVCEAVGRPNMRFEPIKHVEQQAVLAMHRVRQGFVKARTAQGNQIRGLLAEFEIIVPQCISNIAASVPELIEDASNELPGTFRVRMQRLLDPLKELDREAEELEAQIQTWHRSSEISASALVASIGDAKSFDSGRQLAAWLGLVPKQHYHRRKVVPAEYQQARRYLSSNAPETRRSIGDLSRCEETRIMRLGQRSDEPAEQECGRSGLGQQECSNRLVVVGP